MVVVNPDKVTVLHVLGQGFGEDAIDFFVRVPSGLFKGDLARVVMKQGP